MKLDIRNVTSVITLIRDTAEDGAYAALATSDVRGESRARMVVLRGSLKDDGVGPAVITTTHAGAPKLRQLRRNARGELVLWLEGPKLQIRTRISTQIIGPAINETLRGKIFRALSPETQLAFWGPAPGTALVKIPAGTLPVAAGKGIPPAFVALVLRIREIDILQLIAGGNKRVRHVKTSRGWSTAEIIP